MINENGKDMDRVINDIRERLGLLRSEGVVSEDKHNALGSHFTLLCHLLKYKLTSLNCNMTLLSEL